MVIGVAFAMNGVIAEQRHHAPHSQRLQITKS